LKEDALDRILERCGLYKSLYEKREEIVLTLGHLFNAVKTYHGESSDKNTSEEVIEKLIWDLVKFDPLIVSTFIENERFDLNELKEYGGLVSRRIVLKILSIAEDAVIK
jgi:hypothetical protein